MPSPFPKRICRISSQVAPGTAVVLLLIFLGCRSRIDAPATPYDRIAGQLLSLFPEIDLLCLGEEHGSPEDARLREAVIRHTQFAKQIDLVLVEFVSPLHQEVIDRLILEGEAVPRELLQPAWLDAGLGAYWDLPHYEAFLQTVADVNRRLPVDRRIPVIGVALPIPWSTIGNPEALLAYLDRQSHYAERVRELVFDPGLQGLAIFGAGHCERSGMGFPAQLIPAQRDRVAAVAPIPESSREKARAAGLPIGPEPSWIPIRGTSRADLPADDLLFEGHGDAQLHLGEIVDGLIDAGDRSAPTVPPDTVRLDPETLGELDRRSELLSAAQGLDPSDHPASSGTGHQGPKADETRETRTP